MSKSILVPLGGDPSFSPLWGGAPVAPSPLPLSYPCGLNGLCGSGKSPWDFPAGGRPCDGPSIPCELTFILVMIPLARLPLWHPAMPSKSPSIASFLRKLAWVGSAYHFRFGTLAVSAHWPFGTLVPSGEGAWGLPLPNRGCPWDSSGPGLSLFSLSAILYHHYGYYSRGGGVVTLHSVRVYTPCGLTFVCPVSSSAPWWGWGDPWSDFLRP